MADLPYRIVIGLEVHVQLLTQTKLFCGCSTQFGLPPNSATCPVCIGLPGVLPVMNRRAFDLALRAALALNCGIARFTKWDRKNYYYPDLPKNYQISQYDLPFSHDGWLEIPTPAGSKRIGIIRVHLEEDAGKMLHDEHGTGKDSLVDLNRAGTPLLEIVSQPDLSSPEEAKAYLEEIRLLLREIGVSDCEMQEGSLRCDANVNIHIPQADGSVIKTPIVEVKNLNSFRAVERAVKYEAERQYEEALRDDNYRLGQVSKATAGWDEVRGATIVQRRKEEASDYRYFPEPDLVPVVVEEAWLERARAEMGELPAAQRVRLIEQYGLSPYDAGVLTVQGRALVAYFEEAAQRSGDARAACNWIANQVLASLKERKIEIKDFPLNAERLAELIAEQKAIGLNKQMASEVYNHMLENDCSAKQAIDALGIKPVADTGALVEIVRRALAANAKAVADFKAGKTKAAQAIKGAVMRETKGTARPEVVEQIILEELQKVE
ncbi:MAG TPA: Asp-tRNA(Asn)/Glu-tRNA(Gln) amidotransferase subunit GatB [Gemmataceae bacterium]|nr:Asp-tRNA(Asn)/Glu-tRNA(Gln) amidotransferase subunit GatB [Gemmataceae bacterium]